VPALGGVGVAEIREGIHHDSTVNRLLFVVSKRTALVTLSR
jgi:hypothetical protein